VPVLWRKDGTSESGASMARFGDLEFPDELLDRQYALMLLAGYFRQDAEGYVYSGTAFDTYPDAAASEQPGTRPATHPPAVNAVTDSDLVALSLLSIRVTGYQALIITGRLAGRIHDLLAQIPPDARIEDEDADKLLARGEPAWELWQLLRDVKDRRTNRRLGPVAAGKLLARKRPGLIPIADSCTSKAFSRKASGQDVTWWDDVRSALRDPWPAANGVTLWQYLADLRAAAGVTHLPILRVLDILGWMHGGGS
jgi:hypothetical protein